MEETLDNEFQSSADAGWEPTHQRELRELIEANRTRALWSMPPDYYPTNLTSARLILERIAARGDRATFVRARRLLQEMTKAAS